MVEGEPRGGRRRLGEDLLMPSTNLQVFSLSPAGRLRHFRAVFEKGPLTWGFSILYIIWIRIAWKLKNAGKVPFCASESKSGFPAGRETR